MVNRVNPLDGSYFFLLGGCVFVAVVVVFAWRRYLWANLQALAVSSYSLEALDVGWLNVNRFYSRSSPRAWALFPKLCKAIDEFGDLNRALARLEQAGWRFEPSRPPSRMVRFDIRCFQPQSSQSIRLIAESRFWGWRVLISPLVAADPLGLRGHQAAEPLALGQKILDLVDAKNLPFSLLYLELNGLGDWAAEHGSSTWEEFLALVQIRLAHSLKAEDIIVQQEPAAFVVLLCNTRSSAATAAIASRLLRRLGPQLNTSAAQVEVMGHIGIANAPEHGLLEARLLSAAQSACTEAKLRGLAFYQFDEEVRQNRRVDRLSSVELKTLSSADCFRFAYRPVKHLKHHDICCFEVQAKVQYQGQCFGLLSLLHGCNDGYFIEQILLRYWHALAEQIGLFEYARVGRLLLLLDMPFYGLQIESLQGAIADFMQRHPQLDLVLLLGARLEPQKSLTSVNRKWQQDRVHLAPLLPSADLSQLNNAELALLRFVVFDLHQQALDRLLLQRIKQLSTTCFALGPELVLRNMKLIDSVSQWSQSGAAMVVCGEHGDTLNSTEAMDFYRLFHRAQQELS